jgi:hypothetical protein
MSMQSAVAAEKTFAIKGAVKRKRSEEVVKAHEY